MNGPQRAEDADGVSAEDAERLLAGDVPDADDPPPVVTLHELVAAARRPAVDGELAQLDDVLAAFRAARAANVPQGERSATTWRTIGRRTVAIIGIATGASLGVAFATGAVDVPFTAPAHMDHGPATTQHPLEPTSSSRTIPSSATATVDTSSTAPPPLTETLRRASETVAAPQRGLASVGNEASAPSATAPGQTGETPSTTAPGQTGPTGQTPPTNPPGQTAETNPPGQTGQTPSVTAPGQTGQTPTTAANPPGRTGETPSVTAPGPTGQTPSITAPGQTGEIPSATEPRQSGATPSVTAPGQTEQGPSANAPGHVEHGPSMTSPGAPDGAT